MQKSRTQTFLSIFLIALIAAVPILTLTASSSVHAAGTATVNYSTGAASYIQNLVNNVTANGGWLQSIQTCYDGIALGQTTIGQLQTLVDGLGGDATANWQQIFYWYYVMQKFQVTINETTIEAALDAAPMLQNGLPYTDSSSGSPDFLVYNRYLVNAYVYAQILNYDVAKWNVTTAYESFKAAITNLGTPALWVSNTTVASGIGYGPRYYDECAETIDMFLQFWEAGISDGMIQAEYWWNWTNSNLWNTLSDSGGSFYQYALNWVAFECEAGGMNSIMWQLYYYNSTTPDMNNLITDMQTRWLADGWSSPQWSQFVTVHASGVNGTSGNSQTRLENTIMSWAAMLGLYANMTNTMQTEVQELLNGSNAAGAPAWELLEQSNLYDSGLFSMFSNSGPSGEATADAACLMMYLATIPVTGSLAVPLAEVKYEDINNIIDGGISNINLTSDQLTISVMNPGNFTFTFGSSPVTCTLPNSGIWQLTFSPDWNTVITVVRLSQLSKTRIYLGTLSATASASASHGVVDLGQTSSLSSSVTFGTSPYTYQWFSEAPGTSSYSLINGATSASYNFTTSSSIALGTWRFEVQVTDTTGAAINSTMSSVTVNVAPTVSIKPASWVMDVGQNEVFSANPTGGSGSYLFYQWYVGGVAQGGATDSTFSYSADSAGNPLITVTTTDSLSATSIQSSAPSVTVDSALVSPTVSVSPDTVDQGQTSSLTSTAVSTGSSPYSYQWFEKAPGVSYITVGANSASFSFATSGSTAIGSWSFILQVTDNTGAAVNSTATVVTVNAVLSAPTASASEGAVDVGSSSNFSVSVDASGGTAPYSYQWLSEAPGGTSFSAVPGATSSSYAWSSMGVATGTWSFLLQVTDAASSVVTSNAFSVTVNSALVAPATSASRQTVDQSQTSKLSFSNVTTGTSPYTYQWFSKAPGASTYSLINGATSASYNFTASNSIALGTWLFKAQITDSAGATVNSTVASVTVNSFTPVFIAIAISASIVIVIVIAVTILLRKRQKNILKGKKTEGYLASGRYLHQVAGKSIHLNDKIV